MGQPAKIFISYAHEDENWVERLRQHLKPLVHSGLIEAWYDRYIQAGSAWSTEIEERLKDCTVFLAVLSPAFLDSDYVASVELPRALARQEQGQLTLVPVVLRPVDLEMTPLRHLNALPRDAKAITEFKQPDRGLMQVAQGVRRLLEQRIAHSAGIAQPEPSLYLNHTSFLRPDKQAEFQARYGVLLDHYDIRVVVDAEDDALLDQVERVEYRLHDSYPEPIRIREARDRRSRFLLKELAYGEYLLHARVSLRARREPILLQRFITLWKSGPEL